MRPALAWCGVVIGAQSMRPLLLGEADGAPTHVARHVGAAGLALAIGFVFAALRPRRAAGSPAVCRRAVRRHRARSGGRHDHRGPISRRRTHPCRSAGWYRTPVARRGSARLGAVSSSWPGRSGTRERPTPPVEQRFAVVLAEAVGGHHGGTAALDVTSSKCRHGCVERAGRPRDVTQHGRGEANDLGRQTRPASDCASTSPRRSAMCRSLRSV